MKFPKMISQSRYPTVFFGNYFVPDGVKPLETFIRHPIEWLVLDVDLNSRRALLLSKYVLDWEGFADCPIIGHGYETSWEVSYLRAWLNSEFHNESFCAEEQEQILPVTIDENGKYIEDKLFLLSAEEVKRYFATESAAAWEPMINAPSGTTGKDAPIKVSYYQTYWWTRTSGATKDLVVCVDCAGNLSEADSNSSEFGVRPAMWVKL